MSLDNESLKAIGAKLGVEASALLKANAKACGFDRRILRFLIALYTMERIVSFKGVATAGCVPGRGVVAGCSFGLALAMKKAYFEREKRLICEGDT